MKIIGKLSTDTYSEVGQTNPLRWMFLEEKEEGVYQSSSGWIKCKDFFNDVVYFREAGKGFGIYSFDCSTVGTAKGKDVAFLMKGTKEGFDTNLGQLNKFLHDNGFPTMTWGLTDRGFVLTTPSYYWESTYRISLLSFLIRICNINKSVKSWEELLSTKQSGEDQGLLDRVVKENIFFKIPKKYAGYFYYAGKEYNGNKGKDNTKNFYSTVVHNNGMISWYNAMNGLPEGVY